MLRNRDQIARPAAGRFFAFAVPEAITLLNAAELSHSAYCARIDLIFRNPERSPQYGAPLLSLYQREALVFYSFAQDQIAPDTVRHVVPTALARLAECERAHAYQWSKRASVSFRAYLGSLGKLTITRRARTVTLPKYRGGAKFSNAFKPSGVRSEEKVLHEIALA